MDDTAQELCCVASGVEREEVVFLDLVVLVEEFEVYF